MRGRLLEFESEQWKEVVDPRIDASVRVIAANRLLKPDECIYEAGLLLRQLFGSPDLDALGGARAAGVLFSLLRQFGSDDPAALVILKAIRKPVIVLRSTDNKEILVRPKRPPRELPGDRPRLKLYHTGGDLALPLGRRDRESPIRLYYPDPRYRVIRTIGLSEWGTSMADAPSARSSARELRAYAGQQRSLSMNPDVTGAMIAGRPVSFIIDEPSINLIRLSPRPGTNNYTSVRFGINFSSSGEWVTDIWTKWSDFGEFLRVYPQAFTEAIWPEASA